METTISYYYKLKSHPKRLLVEHVRGVHRLALECFDQVKFDFPNFIRDNLREVISVAALFHDFGKATPFFQDYLKDPQREGTTEQDRARRRHGLLSALLIFGILNERFPGSPLLSMLGFIIVRRHHGNLENFRNLITILPEDLEKCQFQSGHIDYSEYGEIVRPFGFSDYMSSKFLLQSIDGFQLRNLRRLDRTFTSEHYFVLNLLYSLLLNADKTDAILQDEPIAKSEILKSSDVLQFKTGLNNDPENSIDDIRNRAFLLVEQSIEELDSYQRILSINIPTGSGKTITSLNAALRILEKFDHNHIIYCLPFTSIIDQNFSVFDEIRKSAHLPDESGILLKHHHLTDICYNAVDDEHAVKEYSHNKALHLIEGWESRITVTTFVQFMYSLISYKNASLRKFHRLSNAVIILDEVQTIPHHYWILVREMLVNMAEWLDSRIIMVTATMPLIFSEEKGEIKELVSEKQAMFRNLSRIELDVTRLASGAMDWTNFCQESRMLVKENPGKEIMFVMNTIRSARELYQIFSNTDIPHHLEYLSSHVIPKERSKRIDVIKERNESKPVVVVSTQLVEAGVDIDLDIVARDFAPLDSIFQTCGRCNRESRDGVNGKVILYSIRDSGGWVPANIYGSFLRQKTEKVLKERKVIPESEFFLLAEDYFNEVYQFGSQKKSYDILERIRKLEYNDTSDGSISIELINDDYTSSIFIEYDDEAIATWKNYLSVMDMDNGFEKNVALKKARRKLAEYIINVPKRCLPDEHDTGIYHLCNDRVKKYYDPVIGFNTEMELPPEKICEIF